MAAAQISPLTIDDTCEGNTGTFSLTLPTSPTASITGSNFTLGASGSCDPDLGYGHVPMFRFGGDTANSSFYDSGTPYDQALFGYDSTGAIEVVWLDLDNRGSVSASWCAHIRCCGSNGFIVDHTWTFNNYAYPYQSVPFSFLVYTDLDVDGSSANVVHSNSTGDRHLVTRPSCPDQFAEFWGESPTSWDSGNRATIASKMVSDPFVGLAGGVSFAGDYAGAMAWDFTMLPFEPVTVRYSLAVNCMQCSTVASVVSTPPGLSSLTTTSLGSLGSPINLVLSGGANAAPGSLLWGTPSPSLPLGFVFPTCTTEMLHVSVPISTLPMPTAAGGSATFAFPGLIDPTLCGVTLEFQYGAIDFGLTCPFNLSNQLAITLGRPAPLEINDCFSGAKE